MRSYHFDRLEQNVSSRFHLRSKTKVLDTAGTVSQLSSRIFAVFPAVVVLTEFTAIPGLLKAEVVSVSVYTLDVTTLEIWKVVKPLYVGASVDGASSSVMLPKSRVTPSVSSGESLRSVTTRDRLLESAEK